MIVEVFKEKIFALRESNRTSQADCFHVILDIF